MPDGEVHGVADDKFAAVREQFEKNLSDGTDIGASFCVTRDGETVIDLWGGWADEERTRPWEKDTIVNVYSTTKTMTALTALWLADQGKLDFDAPVAEYWPEFAANGKDAIKVSHLMSHSAGLSGWTSSTPSAFSTKSSAWARKPKAVRSLLGAVSTTRAYRVRSPIAPA